MGLAKNSFLRFSELIPLSVLKRISPVDIYLPYHHIVSNGRETHVSHLYQFKNEQQFEKDLDYLLKKFKPIQVSDLVDYVKEKRTVAPDSFMLTFDDGFRECFTVIAPILHRKGIPAIFFLNNNYIGNNKLFYRLKISLLIEHLINNPGHLDIYKKYLELADNTLNASIEKIKTINQNKEPVLDHIADETGFSFGKFLQEKQPFLTEDDIDQMVGMGFSIGGHSLSHPYFQFLSEDEQVHEAVASTKRLAARFNQPHLLFSFPHYDNVVSEKVIKRILGEGIDVLFGIQNQLPELQNNMLHRFNAERPSVSLNRQIKAEMLYTAILRVTGNFKANRN